MNNKVWSWWNIWLDISLGLFFIVIGIKHFPPVNYELLSFWDKMWELALFVLVIWWGVDLALKGLKKMKSKKEYLKK